MTSWIFKKYCIRCDKKQSTLCKGCIRISAFNKDRVPIGFNENVIEPVYDEY